MPEFKLNSQRTIDENYQGINISEFTYSNVENLSAEDLIDSFIHSKSFTEESRREIIKNDTENRSFLSQAFEIDLINLSDFRIFDRNGIAQYLKEYSEQDDWNDNSIFVKIKNIFIQSLNDSANSSFYVINKEWFSETDKKLREPESWIYCYYLLIIWLNKGNKTLTVSEWTYD